MLFVHGRAMWLHMSIRRHDRLRRGNRYGEAMAIDYISVIESEGARIVAALDTNRDGKIPWSERWTVATCARHVGGTHHIVAQVLEGRPTADFGLFATLATPEKTDPGFAGWVSAGTAALVAQMRVTDPDAECWSWAPQGRTAGFWQRRMAHETLVHRWDAELGAGVAGEPMAPDVAADGIDEYLDVFVGVSRGGHSAPAGPSFHFHCTDTDGEWLLQLPAAGERLLTREHAKGDIALRGPAGALLLVAWGRVRPEAAGVDVVGDATVIDRWNELLPPM
jgi:uncharacterized protein (TIGR03083 family)